MTLSQLIIVNGVADLAVVGLLAFVMSRAAKLEPNHPAATETLAIVLPDHRLGPVHHVAARTRGRVGRRARV